jgi:hypothetical protein
MLGINCNRLENGFVFAIGTVSNVWFCVLIYFVWSGW